MVEQKDPRLARRKFFRALGASAATALATGAPFAGEARAKTETSENKHKRRYQETRHVMTFYRVNRYPTK